MCTPTTYNKLTLKTVKARLAGMGMTVTCTDGEYRVNFKGGKEATAYYTDSLSDAAWTAVAMYEKKVM